jgi:GNAT superfamily N-acetyltransferase
MIRAATASDASQVYRLIKQLQQSAGVEVPAEAAFVRQFDQALAEPRLRAFVAEASGDVQGVITLWMRESLFHGERVALIDELVVDESQQGQGIGSQLVERVVEVCARLGCVEVEVSTETDNEAARRFYGGQGFAERGVLLEREL